MVIAQYCPQQLMAAHALDITKVLIALWLRYVIQNTFIAYDLQFIRIKKFKGVCFLIMILIDVCSRWKKSSGRVDGKNSFLNLMFTFSDSFLIVNCFL